MAESQKSGIGSALSYQYMSSLAFVASGGLFYIFIAKFLPTSSVGAISLLLAITSLMNILFSFGFPISAQHFISFNLGKGDAAEMHSLARRLLFISLLLSLAGIAFTIIMARPFALLFFHNSSYTIYVEFTSVYIAALVIFGVLHGSALGFQLFKTDAKIYLSSASISYFVGLILFFFFHDLIYLLLGLTLSYVYGSIIYIVVIFFRRPAVSEKTRKTTLKLILSYSWPIILSNLIGYGAVYVDRFVVAYFLDLSTLGVYTFVLTVSTSLTFLATPIVNILVPKLSEFYSVGDREGLKKGLNLASTMLVLIYSPLVLGIASIAPIALSLLANSNYERGYVALIILFFVTSIFILRYVIGSVIYAVRKTRVYVFSTTLTLLTNVSLSFFLIPRFGMVGAAIANSSVIVGSFFVLYYYAIIKDIGNFDWVTVLKVWLSAVVMFVVVTAERMILGDHLIMLPLYIVTGALVYVMTVNLIHPLHRLDREEFLSYVPLRFNLKNLAAFFLGRAF